jgi:hypothetical protein
LSLYAPAAGSAVGVAVLFVSLAMRPFTKTEKSGPPPSVPASPAPELLPELVPLLLPELVPLLLPELVPLLLPELVPELLPLLPPELFPPSSVVVGLSSPPQAPSAAPATRTSPNAIHVTRFRVATFASCLMAFSFNPGSAC